MSCLQGDALADADAVRDHNVHWSGRGQIPFMRGCFSRSYLCFEEAEEFFRDQTGLREISYFKN